MTAQKDRMTANTESMEARSLTASGPPPSRRAQAARSLWAADKLPQGSPERAAAIHAHFVEFAPPIRRRA